MYAFMYKRIRAKFRPSSAIFEPAGAIHRGINLARVNGAKRRAPWHGPRNACNMEYMKQEYALRGVDASCIMNLCVH